MSVFLFTDIEGSTEKWERYKEKMGKALAKHDTILKKNIEEHNGKIIKHTGDGVFAIFEDGKPLECALEIQKQFEKEDWGDIGEIRIRIGLHAGNAEKRGEDYFGPVINRTARVMAIAWGGQIILTPEVKNVTTLPKNATLKDMGFHLLKDLNEPRKIYQLIHPSLRLKEFPPLHSLSSHPNNLPVQTTPFLGRENELNEIVKLIEDPSCRLLTLIGPGGIGKTRLAIQAAAERIEHFSNGVYFIPLAPLSSADFLISTIADSIKFSFYSSESEKVQLLNYLREKEILLILDNFEHLIEGANIISEILTGGDKVKILVTSRELLNLKGEWIVQIDGMKTPEGEIIDIGDYSAVQLFLHNARRVKPNITLSDEDERYVVRICQLVGGMPLGIEIASSWLRSLSCKEITQEIEKNLDFLSTSMRDMPERHRSLRAIFDNSWHLLSQEEREVFMKMSVFRGGFTREAAEKITGVSLPLLGTLIDKSLLQRNPSGRYEILEVLRKYAELRLNEHSEMEETVQNLHCDFYANFLNQKEKDMATQERYLEEIVREIENIRKAWWWAIKRYKKKSVRKLILPLYKFYERKGWYQEGEEIFGWAVNKLQKNEKTDVFGKILSRLGWFSFRLGNLKKAKGLLQRSLSIFCGLDIKEEKAFSIGCLASVNYELGNYEEAKKYANESFNIYKKLNNKRGIASSLNRLGIVYYTEDYNKSKQFFQKSLEKFREIDDQKGISACLSNLGGIEFYLGNYKKAKQIFSESLTISKKSGNKKNITNALGNIGVVANALGEYNEAKRLLKECIGIEREIGNRNGLANTISNLADIYKSLGNYKKAKKLFEEGLAIFRETGHQSWEAEVLLSLAEVIKLMGDFTKAKKLFNEGFSILKKIGDQRGITKSLIGLGKIYLETREYQKSKEYFYKALKSAKKLKAANLIAMALTGITEYLYSTGKEKLAFEIISFVSLQITEDKKTKIEVNQLHRELEAKLSKQTVSNIKKRIKTKKLEDIIKMIGEERI